MQQPRIWLVEDEMSIADTLVYQLQQEGFIVTAFERGLPALDAAHHHQPDLAILDVGLPRLLMGTLVLVAVLLAIGREVVATHPVWMLLPPAAIVVAAFFWYPLAPTAAVLGLVFIANMLWFG